MVPGLARIGRMRQIQASTRRRHVIFAISKNTRASLWTLGVCAWILLI